MGYTYNASIYRSYASGNVVGRARTGGLVGEFEDGSSFNSNESKIQDSYASGSVTSTGKAGALVGTLCSGNVLNSYAVGSVTSTESTTGGAIGAHDLALESDDCPEFSEIVSGVFWNSSTIGSTAVSPYGGATGKTTSELKTLATFTSPWSIATLWQADKVWAICPTLNSGYPVLTSLTLQASCVLPVVAAKPVNTVKPTISGSKKKVGAKLTAVKGNWTSAATPTIAYQWYRCTKPLSAAATTIRANLKCSAIARAKSSSYKLATADKKKYIVLKVTATNATGSTVYYSKASTKIS